MGRQDGESLLDSAKEQRRILIEYLLMKASIFDWHGVSDAANDLRELEAQYPELTQ